MTKIEDVRAWADELCETATREGRAGNHMLADRIATNAALRFYYDNVHGLHSIPADAFPYYKQAEWGEITRLYEAYQQDQKIAESVDRQGAIEAKLEALAELVKQLVEAKAEPAAAPEAEVVTESAPVKGKGKKAAKPDPEPEPEPEPEDEPAEDAPESEA